MSQNLTNDERIEQSIEREITGIERKIAQAEHNLNKAFQNRHSIKPRNPKIDLLERTYESVVLAFRIKDYGSLRKECETFKQIDNDSRYKL